MKTFERTVFQTKRWHLVVWNHWHLFHQLRGPDLRVWYFGPFILSRDYSGMKRTRLERVAVAVLVLSLFAALWGVVHFALEILA